MTGKQRAEPLRRCRSLREHEASQDERSFRRAVLQGLANAQEGRGLTLAEVKARLTRRSGPRSCKG